MASEELRVVILGAGGHAQVAADGLLRRREKHPGFQLIGFLDDNPSVIGTKLLGFSVLGPLEMLEEIPHEGVFVAIGDNRSRKRIYQDLIAKEESLINIIHPSAVISSSVNLGSGVLICAGVVVNTGTVIGNNVILNTSCSIDHHNHINDHVHIAPGVHLGGDVTIGEGAFLGMGSVISPQKSVGPWSVIGAGASVIRDVPPGDVVVGVPAKSIKKTQSD